MNTPHLRIDKSFLQASSLALFQLSHSAHSSTVTFHLACASQCVSHAFLYSCSSCSTNCLP